MQKFDLCTNFEKLFKEVVKKLSKDPEVQISCELAQGNYASVYAQAYAYYQVGEYVQSTELFRALIVQKPMEKLYWQGLAATLQMRKDYETALRAWAMIALLDDFDPMPHFHAAEIYFSLDNREEALKGLQEARKRMKPDHPFLGKVETLQKIWKL